jgi:hypothetical protein
MPLRTSKEDPSLRPVACEQCGSDKHESGVPLVVGNSYSIVACWATTGGEPQPGIGVVGSGAQCPAEQHFCCSKECAIKAHIQCVTEHMSPALDAARADHIKIYGK